jgi:hypothetical protein
MEGMRTISARRPAAVTPSARTSAGPRYGVRPLIPDNGNSRDPGPGDSKAGGDEAGHGSEREQEGAAAPGW